jgi:cytochrome c553
MPSSRFTSRLHVLLLVVATAAGAAASEPDAASDLAFFESKIRPLLVKHCYACHSSQADLVEGGLRLDSRPGWQKGGDLGQVIVAGKPDESRLMRAVEYTDEDLAMPPDGVMAKSEIELIRQWISRGAPDPRTTARPNTTAHQIDWTQAKTHWAFQPLVRPQQPPVRHGDWPRNAIDRFVLARLESRQVHPVDRATSRALIRRLSLDLTGLTPSPRDVDLFVADTRPGAWSRLVDRLLASPAYGQRWGRHWLDVVRYADDQLRTEFYYRPLPHAWRYRDWVVAAFNDDLPYDQFIVHQLAGDLLEEPLHSDGVIAVGLLALGMMYQDDGGTPDGVAIAKSETLDDRVDTVTRGFLALTVSCARCHDHKFDPIPTSDYYSLAGIFNNTGYVDELLLATPEVAADYEASQAHIASLSKQLETAKRSDDKSQLPRLASSLADAFQAASLAFPRAHSVRDTGSTDMRIALRGNLRKPGPVAPRRFLQALAGRSPPSFKTGSGRLELARSIADPRNPLTARVLVNRIWQHHFGRGLVETASNFGTMGESPTHPQLLDWLAWRLIETGWSIKQLHRDILLSATYQLSSASTPAHLQTDPDNRLVWRMPRLRLDIEAWRDSMLAVSGSLDDSIGGPAVDSLLVESRRTIYVAVHRDVQTESDKLLRLFDFPNPRIGSGGRNPTTIPQQQLFALNSPFVIQLARQLASRAAAGTTSTEQRISRVVRIVLGRHASPRDMAIGSEFLGEDPDRSTNGQLSTWQQYCQVLLGSNEFLFRP